MYYEYRLYRGFSVIRDENKIDIKVGCTLNDDLEPELIKIFNDALSAKEELSKYTSEIMFYPNDSQYTFSEYYIEDIKYDDDDEILGGGHIIDISPIKIPVIDKICAETIKYFTDLNEAEIFANENDNYYVGV